MPRSPGSSVILGEEGPVRATVDSSYGRWAGGQSAASTDLFLATNTNTRYKHYPVVKCTIYHFTTLFELSLFSLL